MRLEMILVVIIVLLLPVEGQYEINELCLLVHSYEAPGINVSQLHVFLEEKGWKNVVCENHVQVEIDNKTVYLVPGSNDGSLATFWLTKPPTEIPMGQPIIKGKIIIGASFKLASVDFVKGVARVPFPTAQLGFCCNGTEELQTAFRDAGYKTLVAYNPATSDNPGDMWLIVLENENSGVAIDSHWGIILKTPVYYNPYFCLEDSKNLYLVNPHYKFG